MGANGGGETNEPPTAARRERASTKLGGEGGAGRPHRPACAFSSRGSSMRSLSTAYGPPAVAVSPAEGSGL